MDSKVPESALPYNKQRTNLVDVQKLLGPPALFAGEDQRAYNELLERVQASVQPIDMIEEICVRDVVDLVWEVLRLRRIKAALWGKLACGGLAGVISPILGKTAADDLLAKWKMQDRGAIKKVDQILEKLGSSVAAAIASTIQSPYEDNKLLDPIERIDRLMASAEARRTAIVREMERRRAFFANALRRETDSVQDAAFTEVARGKAAA